MSVIEFTEKISFLSLLGAWDRFVKGKSKRKDIVIFERHLEDNLFALLEEFLDGSYRHGDYHEFHIFDPKHRIIHKATVRDRVIHHLLYARLLPVFERSFIFDSYSCRDEKGTHAAVRRLEMFTRKVSQNNRDSCWALKFDIRKFFDSVDHEILLNILRKKIPDARMMALVTNIVESFAVSDPIGGGSILADRKHGLPIGNLTSQLFANVYMDAFDHFVKETLLKKFYIRYTDDAVILAQTREELEELIPWIEAWLWGNRRLTLHPKKLEIQKFMQGIDFLGYVVLPHHTVLRTTTKRRMMERVNQKNISSYLGMLCHGAGHRLTLRVLSKASRNACSSLRSRRQLGL